MSETEPNVCEFCGQTLLDGRQCDCDASMIHRSRLDAVDDAIGLCLSKVSEICKSCELYDDCNNKKIEACACLIPKESLANPSTQQSTEPIVADMAVKHKYMDIKITENTTVTIDLEKLKKKIKKDFYKGLLYKAKGEVTK